MRRTERNIIHDKYNKRLEQKNKYIKKAIIEHKNKKITKMKFLQTVIHKFML